MQAQYTIVLVELFGFMCSPAQVDAAIIYKSEDGIVYLSVPGKADQMLGLGALSEWKWKLLMRKRVVWEHKYWDQ